MYSYFQKLSCETSSENPVKCPFYCSWLFVCIQQTTISRYLLRTQMLTVPLSMSLFDGNDSIERTSPTYLLYPGLQSTTTATMSL